MGTINKNRDFYRNCINVLGKTDYQVIISIGTNTDHFDDLPASIEIYESVDQMAMLFPQTPEPIRFPRALRTQGE